MTSSILLSAFLIGLTGSLHCAGMCGPLLVAVLPGGRPQRQQVVAALTYHSGRILTYGFLGLVLGKLGQVISWFAWQQRFSLVMGGLIILFLLWRWLNKTFGFSLLPKNPWMDFRGLTTRFLFQPSLKSRFTAGVANGILPCGLVYLAIAGAIATGGSLEGMGFMIAFGLGTLPLLTVISVIRIPLRGNLRQAMRNWYPAFLFAVALFLILRGMNLGIPMLSPRLQVSTASQVECR